MLACSPAVLARSSSWIGYLPMTRALALLLILASSVRSLPQGAAKMPGTLQASDGVASVAESTNWTTLAETTNCKAKEVHSWCLNWVGPHAPAFGPGWYRDAGWPETAPACASDEVSAGLHKYRSTGCEDHPSHKYEWTVHIVCCPKCDSTSWRKLRGSRGACQPVSGDSGSLFGKTR